MTVYQRICEFEKKNTFKFTALGRRFAGLDVNREWDRQHPNEQPPTIISQEPEGNFTVLNYPDYFVNVMDSIIKRYAWRMIDRRKKKMAMTNEKPSIPDQKLSKTTTSVPSQNKKQRKRIPLKNKSKT
jgi:hypothetical protein